MKNKFMDFFSGLKPRQKSVLVLMAMGVALTLVGVLAYISNGNKNTKPSAERQTKSAVVSMDNNLLDKNQLLEAQKDAQVAKDALVEAQKQEEDKKALAATGILPPPPGKPMSAPTQTVNQKVAQKLPPVPRQGGFPVAPPPPVPSSPRASTPLPPQGAASQPLVDSEIGGISLVSGIERKVVETDKKKEEKRSVFLPPSYMEATTLSGLEAPTSADAKGNPVPMFIRVKAPAQLPNDVKANLRGCIVVADCKGNLGTERAECVTVSLSCMDRRGNAVISQPIVGLLFDSDGRAGLRGHVVTKMGSFLARTAIAGVFSGVGDTLKASATTTTLSPLGSTSAIDAKDLGVAAAGSGLSNGFKGLQKIYEDLAHQTLPIVEIGAARPVTVGITKATTLEIMKLSGGVYGKR